MSYQVLARKWRPQIFKDVIGQQHITRTLQNAIKRERIGHAYLFVGPRGIGKTTTARIFAKALNCQNPQIDSEKNLEPCCNCDACKEITAGNCLDVIEIDGASHNKVDDIRVLRDTVQYTPTHGRKYKVYIIDEVHMLTTQAWNALLKTLEEPPPHVKFLFATTEAHKVLPTIVSRCQRFDLKRIPVPIIVKQLRLIAEAEAISVENEALTTIARAADGGMRDAQSIFDQMIAFCGGTDEESKIKDTDVVDVFGLTSGMDLLRLIRELLNNSPAAVISIINQFADNGRSLERLYSDLLLYLRNLMVVQHVENSATIIEVSESEFQDIAELAKLAEPAVVQRLTEGLISFENNIRNYLNKLIFVEVTLLRVMRDAHSASIDEVISRLRQIEKRGGFPQTSEAEPPNTPSASKPVKTEKPLDPPPEPVEPEKPLNTPPATATPPKSERSYEEESPNIEPSLLCEPTESLTGAENLQEIKSEQPESSVEVQSNTQEETSAHDPQHRAPISLGLETGSSPEVPIADASTSKVSVQAKTEPIVDESYHALEQDVENSTAENLESVSLAEPTPPQKRRMVSSTEVWESLAKNEFVKDICSIFNGKIVDVRG